MRLIDADKLLKKSHTKYDWNDYIDVEDILNAPTVDAVPVIHAHPIFDSNSNYARCSNCGKHSIGYDVDNWDNYCCCCGARMDEKDGDSDE